jgi:hypothetical protein
MIDKEHLVRAAQAAGFDCINGKVHITMSMEGTTLNRNLEVFATQIKRAPLSIAELNDIARQAQIDFCLGKATSFEVALARGVERAHGIEET